MQVRCLHCHEPIELPDHTDLREVTCSSCGSRFSLVGDDTQSWSGQSTKKLGPFELIEPVGGGAFGTVWKARDPRLDRIVAIKVPRKGQLDATENEQFLREARHAAQLRHPSIVPVHEVGRDGNTVYIVSDFVQGVTLDDWLTAHAPSTREAAELCAEIAEALHHAHNAGVIHRDLKPSNIMLDLEEHPHLLDFGLSRREAGEVTMTLDGQILGTPAYMSPEQAEGKGHEADARTDIYSLGAILFRLLTGELPFRGSPKMIMHQKQCDEVPSLRRLNSHVPRDLDTITLKCLERELRKRYPTAQEVASELRRWLNGKPIQTRPITKVARVWRWCRREPLVSALAVMVSVCLVMIAGVSSYYWRVTAESELETRRQLYVSDMNVAGQAWRENNLRLVHKLLKRHEPEPGAHDFRGFEWYHLWHLWNKGRDADVLPQSGRVRSMTVSSMKNRLAVGYADGLVKVWDLRTRNVVRTFRERQGTSLMGHQYTWLRPSVALSPSGDSLAYVADDGKQLVIYSFEGNNERMLRNESKSAIVSISYSPDEQLLAVGCDGGVNAYDLESGEMHVFESQTQASRSVTFSPDNRRLASAGIDGSIVIWDTESRAVIATRRISTKPVWSVVFSPDGKLLASGHEDGTVALWDLLTPEPRTLVGHSDEVRSIAFSPCGEILASGSRDDTAKLWNVKTGREIETLKGHSHNVESLVFWADKDELKLITGSSDSTVKFWTLNQFKPDLRFLPSRIGSLVLRPDGKVLVARQSNRRDISIWNLDTDSFRTMSVNTNGVVSAISVSQRHLAIGSKGAIQIFCADNAFEQESLSLLNVEGEVTALAFSNDGSLLASGNKDGRVVVWQMKDTTPLFDWAQHSRTVMDISFTPDGKAIASGSLDGTLVIRDLATGSLINTIDASRDDVLCVAFSIDGKILASSGADDKTALWYEWREPKDGPDVTLVGHSDVIYGIRFMLDGRSLISASGDRTLRIWDIHDGQQRFVLTDHRSAVESVDIARGANLVVSGDRHGAMRLWRAAMKKEVESTPW